MTTLPPHAREGYAVLRTLPEHTAEERRLRAEVRRLRDQVEALEIALYGVDRGSIFIDVHRHSRIALDLLMRHPRVMGEQILSAIEAALPSPDGRERRNYAGVPDVGNIPSLGYIYEVPTDRPAPDGEPWRKCCEECQYRDRPSIEHVEADCAAAGAAFYCIHREDGAGRHRVCAGFAARDHGRRERDDGQRARRMAEEA